MARKKKSEPAEQSADKKLLLRIRDALDAIGADGLLAEPPQLIRIERE